MRAKQEPPEWICGFFVEDLYCELGVDWAGLDPTRPLQVLIELITKAIKFTRLEPKRLIAVSIGACAKQPERSPDGIKYILTKVADEDAR